MTRALRAALVAARDVDAAAIDRGVERLVAVEDSDYENSARCSRRVARPGLPKLR